MTNMPTEKNVLTGEQAKLTLRVLSGPNLGAETWLGEGTWLIGSHDTDDLTFGEPELAGSHIRIAVESEEVWITAFASGVIIDGSECAINSPMILNSFTPVRVGRTVFSLGPFGLGFSDEDSFLEHQGLNASKLYSDVTELLALHSRRTRFPVSSIPRRLWLGIMVCGLLIAICIAWTRLERLQSWGLSTAPDPRPTETDTVNPAPKVNMPLTASKLVIDLEAGENTSKSQTGWQDIRIGADVTAKRLDGTTLSHARLFDLAGTILHAFDIDGSVRVEGAGELTVIGYGRSDAKVKAALRRLQQDIPGVHKTNDQVATLDRARAFLLATASAELRRSIRITARPDVVSVSGALISATYDEWRDIAARFEEKFKPYIRLESRCELIVLPVVRGVHLGRTPFVVVENGAQLKVGDSMDRIGKITAIHHDGLVVHVGQTNVHMLYPGKLEWLTEEDQE